MKLTKIVLSRDNQRCVLQGMIHIGPASLYQALQKDLDRAISEGFVVFFEGVRGFPELMVGYTQEEVRIRDFFQFLFDLYPELADVFGFVLQKKHIRYPSNAINADLAFGEVVLELYIRGLENSFLLLLLEKRKLRQKIKEEIKKTKSMSREEANRRMNPLAAKAPIHMQLLSRLLMRRLNSVILRLRNEVIVEVLEQHFSEDGIQKTFVHYGEAHIKGIVKHLKKNGWSIIQKSILDLANFV